MNDQSPEYRKGLFKHFSTDYRLWIENKIRFVLLMLWGTLVKSIT